jgi:RNA polymerase sigma-70 factor (ECF subfamily)
MDMVEERRGASSGGVVFDVFFRAEFGRLAALATALCGDRETGCDIAQEALTRTYREWPRVSRLDSPGTWTRRVILNLARDHSRHKIVQRRRLPELASRVHGESTVSDPLLDSEMWAAVASLPERQRAAVALFYIGDRSITEVAEVMGVHEGTVKTSLHKARNQLRRVLSEDAT